MSCQSTLPFQQGDYCVNAHSFGYIADEFYTLRLRLKERIYKAAIRSATTDSAFGPLRCTVPSTKSNPALKSASPERS